MNIDGALQETGCAIFINGDCTTSVERLPDEQFLLMTRRRVCILQCMITIKEGILKRYAEQAWEPARVRFSHLDIASYKDERILGRSQQKCIECGSPFVVSTPDGLKCRSCADGL